MHERHAPVPGGVASASPLVPLETNVLAHGLPSPANLESAEAQAAAVRKAGAEPAIVGVIGGRIIVGVEEDQVRHLAVGEETDRKAPLPWKTAVRDLPFVIAKGL